MATAVTRCTVKMVYDLMDGVARRPCPVASSDTLTGGEQRPLRFDVTTVENHWVDRVPELSTANYQDSVDVVTDFHHGYYLEERHPGIQR